jgi:hypothetical protein
VRLRRGDGTDRTDVPLSDLLRRLRARGVHVDTFEDGYILSAGAAFEIYFFDDPVAEAHVVRIAEVFVLDVMQLYFDRVEGDLH